MTHRFSSLLDRLGLTLMAAALLLPLGLGVAHLVIRRPHLQWAFVNVLEMSNNTRLRESGRYSPGISMMFVNSGNAPTEPMRMVFPRAPEHAEVRGHGNDYEVTLTGPGMDILLDPIAPGEDVRVDIYGTYGPGMEILMEGDQEVEQMVLDPTSFAEPEPWIPNWAVATGSLLLAGLAIQNLALRRCRSAKGPTSGEAELSARRQGGAYRS